MTPPPTDVTPVRIAPPPDWFAGGVRHAEAERLAHRSLVFGAMSIVVNPLLLPSIIGIVYGRRSLRRGTSARSMAIAGIVTGSVGLASWLLGLVLAILIVTWPHPSVQQELQSAIPASMAKQGVVLTDVTCPAVPHATTGTTVTCSARESGAGAVRLEVAFTDGSHYSVRAYRG